MARSLLPLLLALSLGTAAAPASAQVLTASARDAAERPGDPGRDIESITSTYDPAGTWTVAVRFYGPPAAGTSALLRAYLAERAHSGACESPDTTPVMVAAYTDPADRGGKGFVNGTSANVVKTVDADQRGFTLTFADERIAGRAACGTDDITLSRKESFDRVSAFEFPGAPAQAPPPAPAGPSGDATPPSARMRILRDPKAARRGIVRVSLLAATETASASAALHGPGGFIARAAQGIAPGQEIRFALKLGKQLKRLKRTGRLPIRVVMVLEDGAGNRSTLNAAATLRYRRA